MRFIIFIRPPPFIFFIIPCICSMTPQERRKPELIKATRKRRIAAGAGVHVQEVNRLLNEFEIGRASCRERVS
jgi:signal recognition particle GTPase